MNPDSVSAQVLDIADGFSENVLNEDANVPVAGPSQPSTSMADEMKKVKRQRAIDKKKMSRLTPEQRQQLQQLRSIKEVGQFLMPDASPSKRSRRESPVRVPCPLTPGTPTTPPPHIPQPWERNYIGLNASGPSRVTLVDDEDELATPLPKTNPMLFTPSTGIVTMPPDSILDDTLLVDADITVIGFSPTPHSSTNLQTPSSSQPEPSIYEDDLDIEITEWERNVSVNSGSEIDDNDDLDSSHCRKSRAEEYDTEELPSHLQEALSNIDSRDDRALREIAQQNMLLFEWSADTDVFKGERETFVGPSGPTFNVNGMSPFQIFSKIWDDDIINLIVTETNRYGAMLCNNSDLPQFSRIKRWVAVTVQELWKFFAILMLQSIVPMPVEVAYWTPCLSYLKIGNFPDIMPLYRFQLIKRCLHFVDNSLCARGISTKLTKVKPIIDFLNNKFSSLYLPEQEIAIDESLLLWKGRLSFAQLISNKAAQVGIKTYELCESRTGYLWKFIVYTGKNGTNHDENVRHDSEPEGATSQIVYSLLRPLLNKGHTLVMDNFYNSPLLARTLKAEKTDVMGTLRLNREFVPDTLKYKNKANMRSKEVAFSQTRDLTITVWRDANVVSLISTYHNIEVGGKEKYGDFKYRPTVVLDYNLSMGGVDKKDQLLQAFPIERCRNAVWYKKFFRRLLNVSIHNACVIAQSVDSKLSQRQFRLRLVDEILKIHSPPKIQPALSTGGGHFPAKSKSNRTRCKWCSLKKIDTCTAYKCDTCNVNLCIVGCFREYHTSGR